VGFSLLEKNTTYYMFFILHWKSDIECRYYIDNIKGALALNLLNKQGVDAWWAPHSLKSTYLQLFYILFDNQMSNVKPMVTV
jgi:hypothetical protein